MAAQSQRRALGALFLLLAIALAGITWTAAEAGQWIIAVCAGVLAAWLGAMAARALRQASR